MQLLGKSADVDFLREMIGLAEQRMTNLEVGDLTDAAYGEKSPEPLAQPNGYPTSSQPMLAPWPHSPYQPLLNA